METRADPNEEITESEGCMANAERKAYMRPEVTDFGNVRELTRGSGSRPTLDGNNVTRRR